MVQKEKKSGKRKEPACDLQVKKTNMLINKALKPLDQGLPGAPIRTAAGERSMQQLRPSVVEHNSKKGREVPGLEARRERLKILDVFRHSEGIIQQEPSEKNMKPHGNVLLQSSASLAPRSYNNVLGSKQSRQRHGLKILTGALRAAAASKSTREVSGCQPPKTAEMQYFSRQKTPAAGKENRPAREKFQLDFEERQAWSPSSPVEKTPPDSRSQLPQTPPRVPLKQNAKDRKKGQTKGESTTEAKSTSTTIDDGEDGDEEMVQLEGIPDRSVFALLRQRLQKQANKILKQDGHQSLDDLRERAIDILLSKLDGITVAQGSGSRSTSENPQLSNEIRRSAECDQPEASVGQEHMFFQSSDCHDPRAARFSNPTCTKGGGRLRAYQHDDGRPASGVKECESISSPDWLKCERGLGCQGPSPGDWLLQDDALDVCRSSPPRAAWLEDEECSFLCRDPRDMGSLVSASLVPPGTRSAGGDFEHPDMGLGLELEREKGALQATSEDRVTDFTLDNAGGSLENVNLSLGLNLGSNGNRLGGTAGEVATDIASNAAGGRLEDLEIGLGLRLEKSDSRLQGNSGEAALDFMKEGEGAHSMLAAATLDLPGELPVMQPLFSHESGKDELYPGKGHRETPFLPLAGSGKAATGFTLEEAEQGAAASASDMLGCSAELPMRQPLFLSEVKSSNEGELSSQKGRRKLHSPPCEQPSFHASFMSDDLDFKPGGRGRLADDDELVCKKGLAKNVDVSTSPFAFVDFDSGYASKERVWDGGKSAHATLRSPPSSRGEYNKLLDMEGMTGIGFMNGVVEQAHSASRPPRHVYGFVHGRLSSGLDGFNHHEHDCFLKSKPSDSLW